MAAQVNIAQDNVLHSRRRENLKYNKPIGLASYSGGLEFKSRPRPAILTLLVALLSPSRQISE
jgi:hypothetical protein